MLSSCFAEKNKREVGQKRKVRQRTIHAPEYVVIPIVKKLRGGKTWNNADGDGSNITKACGCSLGYAIRKRREEPNRAKGRLGRAQSSGHCRGDYGSRGPVRRKTTKVSGFTAGR